MKLTHMKMEHPYEGRFIRGFFTDNVGMYNSLTSFTDVDDNSFSTMQHIMVQDDKDVIIGDIFYEEVGNKHIQVNIAFSPEHANRVNTTEAGRKFIDMQKLKGVREMTCLINKKNRASRLYAAHMGFEKLQEFHSEQVRHDCHVGLVQLWRLKI